MKASKSSAVEDAGQVVKSWPIEARWIVSAILLFHVAAVLAGALAAPPSSKLEQDFADVFRPYHQLLDQGDSYRYYSTAFPPTPVVTATLAFKDGRPEKVIRIPDRESRPRLLLQRQLALAHGLMEDFEAARHEGDGSDSRWAHAFATHLGKTNPGCSTVTLHLQMHMVPSIERAQEWLKRPSLGPVDLDSDEFSTAPERIGVFPCDAS